jgi:hypothetical protein
MSVSTSRIPAATAQRAGIQAATAQLAGIPAARAQPGPPFQTATPGPATPYGISSTFPVVLRASRSRCACAA